MQCFLLYSKVLIADLTYFRLENSLTQTTVMTLSLVLTILPAIQCHTKNIFFACAEENEQHPGDYFGSLLHSASHCSTYTDRYKNERPLLTVLPFLPITWVSTNQMPGSLHLSLTYSKRYFLFQKTTFILVPYPHCFNY
jgi:hypothetical protein